MFYWIDDPVLSELQLTENNDGNSVYYTIIEDIPDSIDEPNVLNLDNNELLYGDNVFYLSIQNEQEQNTIDNEILEDIKSSLTETDLEITLPDGTRAYLKNDTNIGIFQFNFFKKTITKVFYR